MTKYDISVPEYHLLLVLSDGIAISNAELARRTFVSAQAANLVVQVLENRGLIERTQDPQHGRILLTELTDRGRETLELCLEEIVEVEQRVLAGIPAEERAVLLSAMNHAADVLAGGYFGDADALAAASKRKRELRSANGSSKAESAGPEKDR